MKYSKPEFIKVQGSLPPITTNFAPPPVEQPPTLPEEGGGETEFFHLKRENKKISTPHNQKNNGV